MNYIKQFMDDNELKVNEKFDIYLKNKPNTGASITFFFNDDLLLIGPNGCIGYHTFNDLLLGKCTIKKERDTNIFANCKNKLDTNFNSETDLESIKQLTEELEKAAGSANKLADNLERINKIQSKPINPVAYDTSDTGGAVGINVFLFG